jgi:uncharacterized membrane protein YcaP (DUF421 family)
VFFDSWSSLGRTALIGTLAYLVLVATLRISGKRTLSKMNAFDLVITVALGSTLSTIILDPTIALAEGVLALAVLIALQYAVAWSCARIRWVEQVVKARPRVVFRNGTYLDSDLQRERLTRSEVDAAIREAGDANPEQVQAVVLETDGALSVIRARADTLLPDAARRS